MRWVRSLAASEHEKLFEVGAMVKMHIFLHKEIYLWTTIITMQNTTNHGVTGNCPKNILEEGSSPGVMVCPFCWDSPLILEKANQ